jgi:hypothetical protein
MINHDQTGSARNRSRTFDDNLVRVRNGPEVRRL